MQKYICAHCGWVYNPEEGFPVFGVKPGTSFDDLPDDFACPVCSAGKKDFLPDDKHHDALSRGADN